MSADIRAKLKRFNNSLVDEPLEPDNPCYVPYLQKAASDPIEELFTGISWSEAATVNLVSGQRSSGKSTELRRLRKGLEEDGCVVFLCDMRDYMNMATPVEITDFFISIMGALSEEFERKYKRDAPRESYWERITKFLNTEVQIEGLSLEAGTGGAKAGIKASLKEDPSFKAKLQEKLRGHVARLVQEAHGFAVEVVEQVRKITGDPDKKVVYLIDSVEHIRGVGADHAERVYKSVENLFSAHAESLHFSLLHVVYTIPPYLTPLVPGLGRYLGGGMVCYLPSVHVLKRDGDADVEGLGVMRRIIDCRYPDRREIFGDTQLDRMALDTGGDFREFFRLIRGSLLKAVNIATFPVPDSIIDDASNHLRRDMLPIAREDKEWLRKIAASKDAELESIAELPRLARFFDTNLVLNYRNDDYWYDVHPLLKPVLKDDPAK
ncbi:MAG: hypothetical protein P4L43_20415 [Syntrophobacteraceae bacterium]|nr:hypothetical protein [Syntrophobacteraceae bacterium]